MTADFDFGFSGRVTTPVVCREHGLVQADTGLNAQDNGWRRKRRRSYKCPVCASQCNLWDHKTCPQCGNHGLVPVGFIDWD